jgi:hypothetical protein
MVIVRQTTYGAYILAEMDGAVSKLRFAAFRVVVVTDLWDLQGVRGESFYS